MRLYIKEEQGRNRKSTGSRQKSNRNQGNVTISSQKNDGQNGGKWP
jgi:hypothetical protein